MSSCNPIKIFSGRASRYLAERICSSMNIPLNNVTFQPFSDGEFTVCFDESIRGADVFLIQSTIPPSDNLMELLLMVDAAKRASARKVIAVIPYFGFARQDRKDRPRVAIGAKLIANILATAGVDRVMTMDLHADQIQGFFNIPVDHLYASTIMLPHIQSLNLDNLVIGSPDVGGSKRVNAYAKNLNAPMVLCHKSRPAPNTVGEMRVIGDVKGKNIFIIDDMVDTAGTLTMAADTMKEQGAKAVHALATHPVLSGPAYERIEASSLDSLTVTDSIPLQKNSSKIKVISSAALFGDTITKVYQQESISAQYIF